MISFKNRGLKRAALILTALSMVFTAVPAIAATVPNAPSGLVANNSVSSSIKLSWASPSRNERNNIQKYVVDYRVASTDVWINVGNLKNTTNKFVVAPLGKLTSYNFRVGARNAAGTNYSYVNATTKNTGITGTPSSLLASPFGSAGVYLTWVAPTVLNDGVIVDYVVSYKASTDSTYTVYPHPASTTTAITVTDLDPKASYTFKVAAKTSNGTSEAISASLVTQSPIVTAIAIGDNMIRGYNISGVLGCSNVACNNFSWATGSDSSVNSHYSRIKNGVNRGVTLNSYNLAAAGAKSSDIDAQLKNAPTATGSYVAIQVGLSDVCKATTVAGITSAAAFQTNLTTALRNYMTINPDAKVFMSSVPNVSSIYDAAKNAPNVQSIWDTSSACPLYLSSSATTVTKNAVISMIPQYNAAISTVCSAYPSNCRYDSLATYNHVFKLSELSTNNYFDLSIAGETMMSGLAWTKSWWGY
jgi:hypothetical protein